MIRTTMTMLALGALAICDVSAMAATKATTKVSHHQQMKAAVVAGAEGAPATDEAKPAKDATKEPGKTHGKGHKAKGAKAKDASGSETPAAAAPDAPQK